MSSLSAKRKGLPSPNIVNTSRISPLTALHITDHRGCRQLGSSQKPAVWSRAAHCWSPLVLVTSVGKRWQFSGDRRAGKRGKILAPDPRSPPTLQGQMVEANTGNLVLWLPPHFPVQCLVHCFFPSMDHLSPVPWLCSVLWHPHRQVIIVLCDCDLFLLTLFTPHPLNQWHWWPHPIPLNYNVAPVPIEEPLTLSGVGWCNIYTCGCVSHYSVDILTWLTVKLIHMLKFNEINFKL